MFEFLATPTPEDARTVSRAANTLARWLAADDRPEESGATASAVVLVGGSILSGADRAAGLVKAGAAPMLILVGGAGHTTPHLRRTVAEALGEPEERWEDASEAEALTAYLERFHGVTPRLSEGESRNSGENAAAILRLAAEAGASGPLIVTQDATMQRRLLATLERQNPQGAYISAPSLLSEVVPSDHPSGVQLARPGARGMWTLGEFFELIAGEIPRLRNDEHGYGPRGAGFIAEVDIPEAVEEAHRTLVTELCHAEMHRGTERLLWPSEACLSIMENLK